MGANTEGLPSTRTKKRSREASRTGERANRQPSGTSPPQHAVAWMSSPAPQLGLVPSETESSPGAPLPLQPTQRTLMSPAAAILGPPPTPAPPLGWSRVPVGDPWSSPVETASPPADLRSPTSPVQPRTSFGARWSTGTPSRAKGRFELLILRTQPSPPMTVPAPTQEPESSRS